MNQSPLEENIFRTIKTIIAPLLFYSSPFSKESDHFKFLKFFAQNVLKNEVHPAYETTSTVGLLPRLGLRLDVCIIEDQHKDGSNLSLKEFAEHVPPYIKKYKHLHNHLPEKTIFCFALLLHYFKHNSKQNPRLFTQEPSLEVMYRVWKFNPSDKEDYHLVLELILGLKSFWKHDLNEISGLKEALANHLFNLGHHTFEKNFKKVLKITH